MICSDSLANTLDGINQVFFDAGSLTITQREEVTKWIAQHQRKSGKFAGMFAPTGRDYQEGVRLFSGEKLKTKLATRHVLTAEAARALVLLGAGERNSLERTERWLFDQCFAHSCAIGECAHSSVGLMRYLGISERVDAAQRLAVLVEGLFQHRDGRGRWTRFPFYYTLLALSEVELPEAVDELQYAAPACERVLKRFLENDRFSQRRRRIVEDALARC